MKNFVYHIDNGIVIKEDKITAANAYAAFRAYQAQGFKSWYGEDDVTDKVQPKPEPKAEPKKTFDVVLTVAGQYAKRNGDETAAWAFELLCKKPDGTDHMLVKSGAPEKITSNAAILTALLEGLRALKQPCKLHIIYAHRGLNTVDEIIKRHGYTRINALSMNVDIFNKIAPLLNLHDVAWSRVEQVPVQTEVIRLIEEHYA